MQNGQLTWITNFIWGIADDVLRDLYVRGKYRDVILPMTVIRRLDAVLEPTKQAVLEIKASLDKAGITNQDAALRQAAGQAFYNTSKFTLRDLKARSSRQQLEADFRAYLDGFSPNVQEIIDNFEFRNQIPRLAKADALGTLIEKFLDPSINLSPQPVLGSDGSVRLPGLDNHAMGTIFEELVRRFNEENNEEAGEHWTPRDAVRLMARLIFEPVADQIESGTYLLYDGACGTGGFLAEAFEYMKKQCKTTDDYRRLQRETLFGVEAKPLPYLLCQMNLLLHGVETPTIDPLNALRFPLREIGDKDRVDVIITNPPFGGEEERGILGNFPEDKQTAETALFFLQLIMRKLKRPPRPGRAAVVVPNGMLFGDGVAARIKEELLKEFNLHTIAWLPNGVFSPYTSIPTNVLFFDRSGPTQEVWYYEHPLPEGRKNYTKTQPLQFEEFKPLLEWWNKREENDRAWKVPAAELLGNNCNLDRKNLRAKEDIAHLPPEQIAADILAKERRIAEIMENIQCLLAKGEK